MEFTLRREDRPIDIINQCNRRGIEQVSIRGCGTVINSLFVIADWALHNGWFVEKNVMSTLTQVTETQVKHRNTTLHLVMKTFPHLVFLNRQFPDSLEQYLEDR